MNASTKKSYAKNKIEKSLNANVKPFVELYIKLTLAMNFLMFVNRNLKGICGISTFQRNSNLQIVINPQSIT